MIPNARTPASTSAAAPTSNARERRRGGARDSGSARRGQVERGVVREDLLVQALQLGAGLDADLLDELRARGTVGGERLRLAARAIEREHPLGVQALAQRVRRDERVELGDHLGMPAGRQVRVDRHLGRAQAQLLEPADLGAPRTARRPGPASGSPRHSASASRGRASSSSRSARAASTSPSASSSA